MCMEQSQCTLNDHSTLIQTERVLQTNDFIFWSLFLSNNVGEYEVKRENKKESRHLMIKR